MRRVLAASAAMGLLASPVVAADIHGVVRLAGGPAATAVVYLQRVDGPLQAPSPSPVIMDQRNLSFAPTVLPVQQGTVIEFHNSDDVQHNVFTPSEIGGRFDLGTYNRGELRSVKLDQIGELLVLCNIHMEMQANVLVLRDRTFALSDAGGAYRIEDVPAGEYMLRVWKGRWLKHEQRVRMPATEDLVVDVSPAS